MSPEEKVDDVVITEEERPHLEKEFPKTQDEKDEDYDKRLKIYKFSKDRGYKGGAQKRIDEVIKKTREQIEGIETENLSLREQVETLPKEEKAEVTDADTVVAGGKKYYTNRALQIMVDKGELSEEDKVDYIERMQKAIITESVKKTNKEDTAKEENLRIRNEDKANAKEQYSFLKDPEDPRYKYADELFKGGLFYNPRGMTLACKKAQEWHEKGGGSPIEREQRTNELEVEAPGPVKKKTKKELTVADMSEQDKNLAEQIYKNLSPEEAWKKHIKAVKRRREGR